MDWMQFIIFFVGIVGLFFWNRTERRTDSRYMDSKLEAMRNLMIAIHVEMNDFHGKLKKQDIDFKAHMKYNHSEK